MSPGETATGAGVRRNDPCTCGSGRRYKECCGRLGGPGTPDVGARMQQALEAQRTRRLDEAEQAYRDVLSLAPAQPDALHMLGVIRYEKGDDREALALIRAALDHTGWRFPTYRHNFGLVLARLNQAAGGARRAVARKCYEDAVAEQAMRPGTRCRVAVVVPCFNHARYLEQALQSVFDQTWRDIELAVIDDGSTDGSADVARQVLARCPFPVRFEARENRGAASTINEGVAMTAAPFVNILNSDDAFAPDRIERLMTAVAGRGLWGMSRVWPMDEHGDAVDRLRHPRAYAIGCLQSGAVLADTPGFALLTGNIAVSSGNLFFSRTLFDRLGGFRDLRYNHDWDFALRALAFAEPIVIEAETYRYRLHAANTIAESSDAARSEAHQALSAFIAWAMREDQAASAYAPTLGNWGAHLVVTLLQGGMAELLDPEIMRAMADGLRDGMAEHQPEPVLP